ncbi:MAG: sugar phosphate nucleotidyltransferase [Candidatus Cryptobacteroides sp.]
MKPTLLVLAAGMGSRYGGLKQMDGLGPSGETIIDYSIYDAVEAGFGKVVYIVREYFREQMEQTVREKYSSVRCLDGSPLEFEFVTQELNKIPQGFSLNPQREKPWGTAHAVLMAKDSIHEPFVVINGDDFYGKASFRIAADWCASHEHTSGVYAIVGFEVDNTLSESGGVSRGICSYTSEGKLTDVVEHHNVMFDQDGVLRADNSETSLRVEIKPKDLCSMNMWCFTPDFFAKTEDLFKDFLKVNGSELKKEFYIPFVVDYLIKHSGEECDVISSPERWFGVTFKEDRPMVVAKFAQLAEQGVYPTPLYKK